jgi:ADP-ribose pyrophosphatase YjhB (NUDIX family)
MLLLLKAHNKGYTKKDGTFVKPFDDKRSSAKIEPKGEPAKKLAPWDDPAYQPKAKAPAKWSATGAAPTAQKIVGAQYGGKQVGLFHSAEHWPFKDAKEGKKHEAKPEAYHPKKGEHGEDVGIFKQSKATEAATWTDAGAVATFLPNGDVPKDLHGIPFRAWNDHPRTEEGWDYVDGQMDDLEEPAMKLPAGKKPASGVIIEEADGRVWVVHPTNAFGGYKATFPKGGAEQGLSLQANAIKECFEEAGLKVEITGLMGDFERGTTVARYYTAKRVGGTPTAMGWESQAVSLVPKAQMLDLLNGAADKPVAYAAGAPHSGVQPASADDWLEVGDQKGSNPGGFYVDMNGDEWYCKFPSTPDHAKNEILASKLYEELGIRTPRMQLIERAGSVGVASELIPVLVKDKDALAAGAPGAREGFAADCWLANWDSVGLVYDNMLVDKDGNAVRLDPGGSLVFRAQGAPKGSSFGDHVGEVESLRSGKNAQAATVFGGVTDADIRAGVEKIAAISDERIHELVEAHGPGNSKQRAALADRLIARKQDLISRFGNKKA